jgi:uncharacterized protein
VVEDCVNAVGVDVNTASAPLLARISGLNATLAATSSPPRRQRRLPSRARRAEEGAAPRRQDLRAGRRLPAHPNGDNPLDASSVHPEAYPVVERILADKKKPGARGHGRQPRFLKPLKPRSTPTSASACRPCRTSSRNWKSPAATRAPSSRPRPSGRRRGRSRTCEPGMMLEGVVTNVTNFGAFVDIGVHQDGLVHVSALSNTLRQGPARGRQGRRQVVKVKVLEVDLPRKRIALTMRSDEPSQAKRHDNAPAARGAQPGRSQPRSTGPAPAGNVMASAFAKLKR